MNDWQHRPRVHRVRVDLAGIVPAATIIYDFIYKEAGFRDDNANGNLLRKVAAIRAKHFSDDRKAFLETVQSALYRGRALDFGALRENKTLSAIGSLVIASRRGSASAVVTLNYDDLLELFLEYHGIVVRPVFHDRHWAGNEDVTVFHPHGFLPLSPDREKSDDIVLGTDEYVKITLNDTANPWRPLLWTILRMHTVVYVGLSGDDRNLETLLSPLKKHHAAKLEKLPYHGVRFAVGETSPLDDVSTVMEKWGVFTQHLSSFENDLPDFLFGICQSARNQRIAQDSSF